MNISEVEFSTRVVATEHEQLNGEAMDRVADTIRTAARNPEEIKRRR